MCSHVVFFVFVYLRDVSILYFLWVICGNWSFSFLRCCHFVILVTFISFRFRVFWFFSSWHVSDSLILGFTNCHILVIPFFLIIAMFRLSCFRDFRSFASLWFWDCQFYRFRVFILLRFSHFLNSRILVFSICCVFWYSSFLWAVRFITRFSIQQAGIACKTGNEQKHIYVKCNM